MGQTVAQECHEVGQRHRGSRAVQHFDQGSEPASQLRVLPSSEVEQRRGHTGITLPSRIPVRRVLPRRLSGLKIRCCDQGRPTEPLDRQLASPHRPGNRPVGHALQPGGILHRIEVAAP